MMLFLKSKFKVKLKLILNKTRRIVTNFYVFTKNIAHMTFEPIKIPL